MLTLKVEPQMFEDNFCNTLYTWAMCKARQAGVTSGEVTVETEHPTYGKIEAKVILGERKVLVREPQGWWNWPYNDGLPIFMGSGH